MVGEAISSSSGAKTRVCEGAWIPGPLRYSAGCRRPCTDVRAAVVFALGVAFSAIWPYDASHGEAGHLLFVRGDLLRVTGDDYDGWSWVRPAAGPAAGRQPTMGILT